LAGQLFFELLNPAIAAVLTATFLLLWWSKPTQKHLLLLGIAFLCYGLAFVANDFLDEFEGPGLRIAVNCLFLGAVLSACVSALMRVRARVPVLAFVTTCAICAVFFYRYLLVVPSVEGRIYTVNTGFAVLSAVTGWLLIRAGIRSSVDRLFVAVTIFLFAIAVVRPTATLFKALDVNSSGSVHGSAYWATVQAVTPLLAILIALTFLVAAAAQMLNELRTEVDQDYLTGILNRRGFESKVATALKCTAPAPLSSALMLADIDNFKQINDTFGHAVGDQVIAGVGRVLALHGAADFVGRTGGEEFALFYHQTRRHDLLEYAERVRSELDRARITGLPDDYPVTISIGIHTRHQSEQLSAMMASADRSLYKAKQAGKNRAVIASIPLSTVAGRRL